MDLKNLLQFENEDDIFKFRFSYDRMLMWPYIRFDLFQKTLQMIINHQEPHGVHKASLKTQIFHILFCLYRSPFIKRQPEAKILFFSQCAPNNTFLRNSKYRNRLVDYHYDLCEPNAAAVIESYLGGVVKKPRSPANLYVKDFINLMGFIKSAMRKSPESDQLQCSDLMAYIMDSNKFAFDDSVRARLKHRLSLLSIRLPYYHHYYKKLFMLYKPRLIFLHSASYGFESFITKWAHDHKIKVAELQHGAVYRDHPAYNYGSLLRKNEEYRAYLPDFFLTYGTMWNDRVSLPGKVMAIGNPHFLNQKLDSSKNISDPIILIASQGSISDDLVNVAAELSKIIPDNFKIIYKLHHGEGVFKERFAKLKGVRNIQLSINEDIYQLINRSEFIVSCYSTTLFEAAALQKKVFIYDHPLSQMSIPKNLGQWFCTAKELHELIITSDDTQKFISKDEIMDPAFEQKFGQFLNQHL